MACSQVIWLSEYPAAKKTRLTSAKSHQNINLFYTVKKVQVVLDSMHLFCNAGTIGPAG